MIAYFDTSAIVPILVAEPSTPTCRRIWEEADRMVTSRLAYVEVAAALAMAGRRGRLSASEQDRAWNSFTQIWPDIDVVDLTSELAASAAGLARSLGLRGYDAVHCASAAALSDVDVVAAAGDKHLVAAWQELGVTALDTTTAD